MMCEYPPRGGPHPPWAGGDCQYRRRKTLGLESMGEGVALRCFCAQRSVQLKTLTRHRLRQRTFPAGLHR
jgi:hypothetical protein